jgi:acyl-CoA hydrolase
MVRWRQYAFPQDSVKLLERSRPILRQKDHVSWVLHLFASGAAYFLGIALVLASLGLEFGTRSRAVGSLAAWCGVSFIALSAIPSPWLLYALFAVAVSAWRLSQGPRRGYFRACVLASVLALTTVEAPSRIMPRMPLQAGARMVVLGDSISAGLGASDAGTWPARIASTHRVPVVNLARAGATTSAALDQAGRIPPGPAVVVVEIGGNDLLAGRPAQAFRAALAALLGAIQAPDRRILMLELPLLPLQNPYGSVQREMARAHGAALVPRRLLADALFGRDHTLEDGLHLSPSGQEWLAVELWRVLEPASDDSVQTE